MKDSTPSENTPGKVPSPPDASERRSIPEDDEEAVKELMRRLHDAMKKRDRERAEEIIGKIYTIYGI
jgi:hypothetical protein